MCVFFVNLRIPFELKRNIMAKKSNKIQYSNEMQKVVDKLGLREENVLYLNITKPHLDRILSGEKKSNLEN